MQSILLVDDRENLLQGLVAELRLIVSPDEVEIRTWVPANSDIDVRSVFDAYVDEETVLVITDYDLTQGQTGLFGSSIVAWCQAKGIPVGDFSRGNPGNLPKEPDLFELRVPSEQGQAAPYIACVFRGFRDIRAALLLRPALVNDLKSPTAVLAGLLDRPDLEGQFALYGMRMGVANAGLMDRILRAGSDQPPDVSVKISFLTYIIGHLLLNSILKFSGPILSLQALCAYFGADASEGPRLADFFVDAVYAGPFSGEGRFFWLSKVDEKIDDFASGTDDFGGLDSIGAYNRAAVEQELAGVLARHGCGRCNGENGGFICPFTSRVVCQRPDCSVGASNWIPAGARLCRIERDFYEEWAPILGM
jgi:hypothetical protein